MPYLDVPGCRLHYVIDDFTDAWKPADTVVFVHGFTECVDAWIQWVPHFAREYRVVRMDQRGFGESGPMAKDFRLTTETIVGDIAALIRHVSNGPVHLIGGKSGGIPVMMLAAAHPELVKTIMVSCSPVTPPKAEGWIAYMEQHGMRAWAAKTQRERMGTKMPQAGIDWWSDMMGRTAVSSAHAYLGWVSQIDIREDIKRIRCPTLVVGTDTPRRGRGEFEGWQKTIPGSELALIQTDGYHAAAAEPDATAAVTLEFMRRRGVG